MILFIRADGHEDYSELVIEEIDVRALSKSYTPDFKKHLTNWIEDVTRTHYNVEEGEDKIYYGQTLRVEGQEGFYVHIDNDACTVLSVPKSPPPLEANAAQFIPDLSRQAKKRRK